VFLASRSHMPRGIRRGSADIPLAGIAGSNLAGALMSVLRDYCVLSGRGLYVGPSLVQKSYTECGVPECDREASIMRPH